MKWMESKFTVFKFRQNKVHFKCYIGFESYEMFKVMLEYLKPAAIYWGWNSKIENSQRGRVFYDLNKTKRIF